MVLADDVDGVRRATAEGLSLTRALQATVRIHTVHQAISFIVLAVCAESLHGNVTAGPSPAWLADTMPAILIQRAASIAVAQTWASLNGAMFSGPALVTFAFAVLAGAVFSAAWVTSFQIAYRTGPALFTATASSYTHTVRATVHCTHLDGAIGSSPVGVTGAGAALRLVGSVSRALVWTHRLQDLAVVAAPSWIAVALSVNTNSVR